MDVKVRRRAVVLALSVPGRLCRCTVSRTAQTVGCDTQWQGENYRDIATLQRSAAFKTLASPLLEGHERAQQPSPPDIVWALSTRLSQLGVCTSYPTWESPTTSAISQ